MKTSGVIAAEVRVLIVSPIDNLAEADGLLAAGADEFYGGCVPGSWRERFDLLASTNQRTFAGAQIASLEELAAILDKIHRAGARFSLTLNAPFYSDEQLPLLLELLDQAVAAGIDGVILADPGLLRLVRRRHPQLSCQASSLAHLGNSAAAAFYVRQGVSRIILPRHLTLEEIGGIVRGTPNAEFEAFLLIGKCPHTEGLCTHHHAAADKIWPCEIPYAIEPLTAGTAAPALVRAMARQGGWATTNRRHGCGLCAIPALAAAGVRAVKLVGRGAPGAQKMRNVRLVAEFIALARSQGDTPAFRTRARQAHRQRFAAGCSRNVCYYPEFFPAEESAAGSESGDCRGEGPA